MEFTDQELAQEIRSGSGVAFERLMSRYERLVYRIAYGFTGDPAAAMDVAQETFLKVYAGIDRWRGRGELKNWVARVAANEAMNWRRHATRHPTSAIDGDGFLADEPAQQPHVGRTSFGIFLERSCQGCALGHALCPQLA